MSKFKVALIANDVPPTPSWVVPQLEDAEIELTECPCVNNEEVISTACDADVVWIMGGSPVVTVEVLPHLKRCRVILRTGTGTDNVPVDEATRLGIVVAHTPETTMHTVAEHAIGLLFAVIRRTAVQDRAVREGIWSRERAWPDWHMVGQTLGLIGFGRIGQLVAKKVGGLEMKVVAYDPTVDAETMAKHGVASAELEELLRRSDFVSIHVPLLDTTYHLIGERELRMMKQRAVLINTSRGKIIKEQSLIRALSEGWIGGAGLDVLETQPPGADHPLLKLDNVVLTPHIAGYSDEFYDNFWNHSVKSLIEMSKNRWPLWYVNQGVKPRWELSSKTAGVDR